jgi:hypothetical protein
MTDELYKQRLGVFLQLLQNTRRKELINAKKEGKD